MGYGPDRGMLGAPVPISLVLGTGAAFAITLREIIAYDAGLEITLGLHSRKLPAPKKFKDAWTLGLLGTTDEIDKREGRDLTDLWVELVFPDGYTYCNELRRRHMARLEDLNGVEALAPLGGGAGAGLATATYWVPRVPKSGKMVWRCSWDEEGIPIREIPMASTILQGSIKKVQSLWPGSTDDERQLNN